MFVVCHTFVGIVTSRISVSGAEKLYSYREEQQILSKTCSNSNCDQGCGMRNVMRDVVRCLLTVWKECTSSESFHWMLCHGMAAGRRLSSH
jgi:hypothetical protein